MFGRATRAWTAAIAVTTMTGLLGSAQPSGQAAPAASTAALSAALEGVDARRVRAHVELLADDLLEGRLPGTRGYDLAARYVATQLALLGLTPAGDGGTYLQQVPLVESRLTDASLTLRSADGRTVLLTLRTDFAMAGDVHRAESHVEAPLAFAGFGVSAPELQHDDYAGLDVRGHIVVVLAHAPARFPSEQRAHHANGRLKAQVAAARGAVGLLVVRTPDDERRAPWARVVAAAPTSAAWVDGQGVPAGTPSSLQGSAVLSATGAASLFALAPKAGSPGSVPSLESIFAQAAAGAPRGVALGVTATITTRSTLRQLSSPNVAGLIEGSDPALRDTTVVYSAHLDHVGVGTPVKGDAIYNGAYDNATGTAILLEAARAIASVTPRPRRSVLFLFVTAEEKGLIGSDYFATRPTISKDRIVANVNVDMPLLLFPVQQVVAFGAEHSSLEPLARQAASLAGLTLIADPIPEENLFVRSDQYSFVRQGVPSVFLVPGFEASDPAVNGPKIFGEFLATHYHQPSDDLRLPLDLASVERFTRANAALGYLIAMAPDAPAWKPGNFFGQTFGARR